MNPIHVSEDEEKLGRLAYGAYFKARAGRNFHDSKILPTWEELGPQNQRAWAAVAEAVLLDDSTPPSLPEQSSQEHDG